MTYVSVSLFTEEKLIQNAPHDSVAFRTTFSGNNLKQLISV